MDLKNGVVPERKIGITISKLCAALITDGTIYKQNKMWNGYPGTSYYFELADSWFENVSMVRTWIKILIGKEGSIRPFKGCYRYRIGSKKLVEYLHGLGIPYGKKSKIVSIPNQILNKNIEFNNAFIGCAILFDGTVKLDGTIEFTTTSKKLFNQIIEILKQQDVKVKTYKQRFERFSNSWKYIFYSKSFDFFMKILEGPKLEKLLLTRNGISLSINRIFELFPQQPHSKAPILKEILTILAETYPKPIEFCKLKNKIEHKYNQTFHRNTILLYLNILFKAEIIQRISRGWYRIDSRRITSAQPLSCDY